MAKHIAHLSIPTFSNLPNEDLKKFLLDFDLACEANEWPVPPHVADDVCCERDQTHGKRQIMLRRALRGKASRTLLSLPDEALQNYDDLRTALWSGFLPPELRVVRRAALRARKRQAKETLTNLADDIHVLTTRLYSEANDETIGELAKDTFIDALEPSLRFKVLDAEPSLLGDALCRALVVESNVARSRESAPVSRAHRQSDPINLTTASTTTTSPTCRTIYSNIGTTTDFT